MIRDRRARSLAAAPERRRPRVTVGLALVVAIAAIVGCTGGGDATGVGRDRPVVVATVAPLAWFVERLAGEAVEVVVLVEPGSSPEHGAIGVRERRALQVADVVVAVGHPAFVFETTQVEPLLTERDELAVVAMHDGPAPDGGDPHVWLSPANALPFCERLRRALDRVLPDDSRAIAERHERLVAELHALDDDLRQGLSRFRGRRFFVFHPAWGAFADRYGLVQVAAEEHGSEPGPRHLAELVRLAREDGATTVFVQPQFAQKGARVLADEISGRVDVLDPLAHDWDANLRRTAEALSRSFEDTESAALDAGRR